VSDQEVTPTALTDRYLAYAEDFERTYADDDWTRLEQYFTEDAAYPQGTAEPEVTGPAAVLERLKASVNQFDRRMDTRTLDFDPPTEDGDRITVTWKATYTKAGLPDITITGTETAAFRGDQICLLSGEFDPTAQKNLEAWLAEHGAKLAE
jgi:hypothetical protein